MLTNFTIKTYMKYQTGLTLIELVITLAVIAVIVAVGIPGMQRFTEVNRAAAQNNLVIGTLTAASSEASKRGVNVVVCASDDGATCSTVDWNKGWIVFADVDGDAAFNNNDVLLGVSAGLTGGLTVGTVSGSGLIIFKPSPNGVVAADTVKICTQDADPKKARAVNIKLSGLISLATDTNSNHKVNDVNGADVTCP